MIEGYLLLWDASGDEIHIDLITPEDAKKFEKSFETGEEVLNIKYTPIIHWFIQYRCTDPWPFSEYKILGTLCACLGA